jgi:hypothetical protein
MLKSLVVGGVIGVIGLSWPMVSYSQTIVPQQSMVNTAQPEISPLELRQYAQAVKQLQVVERKTQELMAKAIASEDLSPQRFMEIGQTRTRIGDSSDKSASPEEIEKFKKALVKVNNVLEVSQSKQERVIKGQGLEISRFNEIGKIIEQDRTLKQQYERMIAN